MEEFSAIVRLLPLGCPGGPGGQLGHDVFRKLSIAVGAEVLSYRISRLVERVLVLFDMVSDQVEDVLLLHSPILFVGHGNGILGRRQREFDDVASSLPFAL